MLVKFRRNWFGPDSKQYRVMDGVQEVADDLRDQLPSDAEIVSEKGSLPESSKPKLPGYGAKPAHELVLDQIPGAAPIHMIRPAGGPARPAAAVPVQRSAVTVAGDGTLVATTPLKPEPAEPDHTPSEENKIKPADLKRAEKVAEKVKDAKLDL